MWLPALSIHHVRSALRRSRSALLALLVVVRSLRQWLQESVCFSHDVQGGLGGVQPLVCASEFAGEPRDLGLFGGEPANLLAGPFARQHPGVALLAPFADQRRIQALPPQIGAAFTVFARLLIGMQMGNLVRRGERATAPRPVGSGVGWIHRFIVVHRGNRGAGHGVPIRISPCVRPICCEPVDSTHPDTQGSAGRFNPQAGVEPTVVYTGPREQAKKTFKEYAANAAGGRWEWVHLRCGGNVVDTWPKDST